MKPNEPLRNSKLNHPEMLENLNYLNHLELGQLLLCVFSSSTDSRNSELEFGVQIPKFGISGFEKYRYFPDLANRTDYRELDATVKYRRCFSWIL